MSGPNAENGYGYDITDDEAARLLDSTLDDIRAHADTMLGIHHRPPLSLDDDEGVGAENGE